MSMRRAKIRPSINLAASRPRRSAPTERSLKSPAKNLSKDAASLRSPVKTVTPSVKSPVKTVQSSPVKAQPSPGRRLSRLSSSSAASSAQSPKGQSSSSSQPSAPNSSSAVRNITKALDSTVQNESGAAEHQLPSKTATVSAPTSEAVTNKQTDKQPATTSAAAPKIRSRRKPAPKIPVRSRPPRQQNAPASTGITSDKADKTKEASKEKGQSGRNDEVHPGKRSDAVDVGKRSDSVDAGNLRGDEGAVAEPPPVRRVVDRPDVTPIPLPKPTETARPSQMSSSSSQFQSFPIHQDPPPVSKTPAAVTKATTAVSKATSTVTKAIASKGGSTPLRTIGPSEKKNPMNIYERKLRELKETLEEETPAKRRRRYVKKNMPSDRSNMTMSDLIYYNPKTNPMKHASPGAENRERRRTSSEIVTDLSRDGSGTEDDEDNDDDAVDQFAPQVKIGPDGELILDQKSLVKDASPKKTFDVSDSDIVHEEFSNTTYASFRKNTRTAMWTKKETEKFYRALSAVGTDFSMINAMFPKRTRHQIKNKFKREEKRNRHKVDAAIRKTSKVSMSMFEHSDSDSESETENRPTRAAAKKSKKRHTSGSSISAQKPAEEEFIADETESTAVETESIAVSVNEDNVSDMEEMAPSENGDAVPGRLPPPPGKQESEDSEEDIDMETILSRPTRSGRQPKMRSSFDVEEEQATRVHARSKGAIRATPQSPVTPIPSEQPENQNQQQPSQATPQTPSSQTFVVPTTTSRTQPRSQGHQKVTNIQHFIINSPVVQATTRIVPNPSPVKTHIYVINSPDGSQRIIQLPAGSAVPTAVQSNRGNPTSPVVIHKVQASQPEQVQSTVSSPHVVATVNAQNEIVYTKGARTPSQKVTKVQTLQPKPVQSTTSSSPHVVATVNAQNEIVFSQRASMPSQKVTTQRVTSVVGPSQILTGPSQSTVLSSQSGIHLVPINRGVAQRVESNSVIAPSQIVTVPSQRTVPSSQSIRIVPVHGIPQNEVASQSVIAPSHIVTAPSQRTVPLSQSIRIVPVHGIPQSVVASQSVIAPSHIVTAPSHIVTAPSQRTVPSSQSGIHMVPTQSAMPHRAELQAQRATLSPAVQSLAASTVTSSMVKSPPRKPSPTKPFVMGVPPKLQRKPYVSQKYTVVDVERQKTGPVGSQQQLEPVQVATTSASSECVVMEYVQDMSDTVIAQEVDVECLDRMSDTMSESGAFIPPVAGTKNLAGEQNSEQLIITGLVGSEGLSERDIFEQISYEQGVGTVTAETEEVGANMTVTAITSDMIQIASEIATEK